MIENFYDFENLRLKEIIDLFVKRRRIGFVTFLLVLIPFVLLFSLSKDSSISTASTTISVEPIQSLISLRTSLSLAMEDEAEYLTSESVIVSALNNDALNAYHWDNGITYREVYSKNVAEIRDAVSVKAIPNTNLLQVQYTHSDYAFAKDFLIALIKAFEDELIGKASETIIKKYEDLVSIIDDLLEVKNKTVTEIELITQNFIPENDSIVLSQSEKLSSDDYLFIMNNLKIDSLLRGKVIFYKNIVNSISEYDMELLNIESIIARPKKAVQVIEDITIVNQTIGRNKIRILIIGVLCSILTAIVLAFSVEWFSDSIGNNKVMIRALNRIAPIISILDIQGDLQFPNGESTRIAFESTSNFIAQYLSHKKKKVIAIHNLGDKEGFSGLVGSIGLSLFSNGSRVLVVSQTDQNKNYQKLIGSLQNLNETREFLQLSNLDLIQSLFKTAHRTERDLTFLLLNENKEQQELLSEPKYMDVRESYDFILIDFPMDHDYTNFISIANAADVNILNIFSPTASRKELNSIVSILDLFESDLSGIIMTRII